MSTTGYCIDRFCVNFQCPVIKTMYIHTYPLPVQVQIHSQDRMFFKPQHFLLSLHNSSSSTVYHSISLFRMSLLIPFTHLLHGVLSNCFPLTYNSLAFLDICSPTFSSRGQTVLVLSSQLFIRLSSTILFSNPSFLVPFHLVLSLMARISLISP